MIFVPETPSNTAQLFSRTFSRIRAAEGSTYGASWLIVTILLGTACQSMDSTGAADASSAPPSANGPCAPAFSVQILDEDDQHIREVTVSGPCTLSPCLDPKGCTTLYGAVKGPGRCHVRAVSTTGSVEEHDVDIGAPKQDLSCGVSYAADGPVFVTVFSQRKPQFDANGACVCPVQRYCSAPVSGCGGGRDTLSCYLRPKTCAGVASKPVCGCDGKVYDNLCEAGRAGTNTGPAVGCTLPPDKFPCVQTLCDRKTEACRVLFSPGYESSSCVPLRCFKMTNPPPNCECGDQKACTCEIDLQGSQTCRVAVP